MLCVMSVIRFFKPLSTPFRQPSAQAVDLTHWKYGQAFAWSLVLCFVSLYLVFSPLGVTGEHGSLLQAGVYIVFTMSALMLVFQLNKLRNKNKTTKFNQSVKAN